jgi:hypothetical protein
VIGAKHVDHLLPVWVLSDLYPLVLVDDALVAQGFLVVAPRVDVDGGFAMGLGFVKPEQNVLN